MGGWCGDCTVDIKGVYYASNRGPDASSTQNQEYLLHVPRGHLCPHPSDGTQDLKLVSQLPGPSAAPSSQTKHLFWFSVLGTAAQGNLLSALLRLQQGRTPETLARCDTAACHTHCVLPLYEVRKRQIQRQKH